MFILILILKILLFKEFKKDIQIMVSMFQQVKIQIFPLINLLFGLIMISKPLEIIFLKIFDIIERSEEMWEIVPKNHSKATGIQTVADDF